MSCIPRLLEMKGNQDVLYVDNSLVIEGGGNYRGYDYLITFNDIGFRCGYVALLPGADLSRFNAGDHDSLVVHGGITFTGQHSVIISLLSHPCADQWIGFDAGHCFDGHDVDRVEKLFPKMTEVQREIMKLMASGEKVRSYEYMEEQCKYLIDQLAA